MSSSPLSSKALYLRLLTYVRPYWRVFLASLVCMGLSSAMEPLLPWIMKKLLDKGFTPAADGMDWLMYPALILVVFIVRAALGIAGDYAMSWVSNNVVANLRQIMFANIVRLPSAYYGDNTSGRLMSRVTYDIGNVTGAATGALTNIVKDSLSIVGLLIWLLWVNWQLTLVAFAVMPGIAIVVKKFSARMRTIARNIQTSQGTITEVLQEAIEGHKIVKIFGGEAYEEARFRDIVQKQRRFNMRGSIAAAAQGPLVQLFVTLAVAIILGIALKQAQSGISTVGDFVSFITAMLMLQAPLKRISGINDTIQRGLAAAESVFDIVDQTPEVDTGTVDLTEAHGKIEFECVTFAYPGSERNALQEVSFTVNAGECVALVGQSGSGKTTIANLLPRFYRLPDQGCGLIRIDDIPLHDIRLKSLRKNIALVSQEVVLFNDTVAANIAYGASETFSSEEIRQAADAANATEFIDLMPQGFHTLIGENGVKLSGGQRQRIAIARALLKNAPILILDEATSALDTQSERLVQGALDNLMKNRTTIVIAHRLSTIENANRIIVMQQGTLLEMGTHAQLVATNGAYAQLHRLQFATGKI